MKEIIDFSNIPSDIILSAISVETWFRENGHEEWELMGIRSRNKSSHQFSDIVDNENAPNVDRMLGYLLSKQIVKLHSSNYPIILLVDDPSSKVQFSISLDQIPKIFLKYKKGEMAGVLEYLWTHNINSEKFSDINQSK